MNLSRASASIRTELETRTWGNSPRAHNRYTVARHTPSSSATSRTVSSQPEPAATVATGAGPSSKLAAKILGSWGTGWDGWTTPSEETRVFTMGCEGLVTAGRPPGFLGGQVVAGSNPVASTIEGSGDSRVSREPPGPPPFGHPDFSSKRAGLGASSKQCLNGARNRRPEREQVESLAHVLDVEVAVGLRGDCRGRVAEDALHGGRRDARLEQQGGGRVSQVMRSAASGAAAWARASCRSGGRARAPRDDSSPCSRSPCADRRGCSPPPAPHVPGLDAAPCAARCPQNAAFHPRRKTADPRRMWPWPRAGRAPVQQFQARGRDALEGEGTQLVTQVLLAEAEEGRGAQPVAHLRLPGVQGLPEGDLLPVLECSGRNGRSPAVYPERGQPAE